MKITYRGDYALKAILDLALHYGSEPVTINDIACRIDAPVKFLEQILLELKKGGFVVSRRGKVGGYFLAKAPNEITIGDVVRFMEGPIEPIACVNKGYTECGDRYKCVFRGIWHAVFTATSSIIDGVTFEALAAKVHADEQIISYTI